jgi:hypothetical protein
VPIECVVAAACLLPPTSWWPSDLTVPPPPPSNFGPPRLTIAPAQLIYSDPKDYAPHGYDAAHVYPRDRYLSARRFRPLRSVLTEIYRCHTCPCHEILRVDTTPGQARGGRAARHDLHRLGRPPDPRMGLHLVQVDINSDMSSSD